MVFHGAEFIGLAYFVGIVVIIGGSIGAGYALMRRRLARRPEQP